MDKERKAIMRLQEASKMSFQIYDQPLVVTDSGGKDSSVCVALAERAGIPFEVQHSHTTADAPETVRFVREKFKKLEADGILCTTSYPVYKGKHTSMWALICEKGPPNRWFRFCCSVLKEQNAPGRFVVTGVRWAESQKRKNNRGIYETQQKNMSKRIILNNDNDEKRRLFETCQLKAKRVCNPIIDWEDKDIWDFIQSEHLAVNPLYDEGWDRVGCVGCPLASTKKRYKEFDRWPKYKMLYLLAFERYISKKHSEGKTPVRDNVEDLFHWWMEDGFIPGQIGFDDLEESEEE